MANESSPELLERIWERARTNNIWRTFGIEPLAAGEGWVKFRAPVRAEFCNADGAPVHGGAVYTLIDMAGGGGGAPPARGGPGGGGGGGRGGRARLARRAARGAA